MNNKSLKLFAFLVVFSSLITTSGCGLSDWWSRPFTVSIDGPKEVYAGDLTVFKAKTSETGVKYTWKILPPSGEQHTVIAGENKEKFAFSSRVKGDYYVVLVGLKSDTVSVATHYFRNGDQHTPPDDDEDDDPDPGPRPPDPPDPQPKPYLDELAEYARDLVRLKVADSDKRLEIAHKLGDSMLGIASSIKAGAYNDRDLQAIREDTRKLNNDTIGWENSKAWFEFSAELAKKIEELEKDNKLKDRTDYALVWEAIGKGLKSIRASTYEYKYNEVFSY